MTKFTRLIAPILAASFVAACGGDKTNADSALAADTTLNRDLALAGGDSAAQPSLTDTAATPASKTASSTSRPATRSTATKAPTKTASGNTKTAPSGTAARTGVIGTGTALNVRANNEICTNTHKVGDKLTATVNEAVAGSNGVSIPAGSVVTLTITKMNRSENVNDPIEMEFSVDAVDISGRSYAINGAVSGMDVQRVRNQPKSSDVKKVLGGAAAGAIIGQIAGKNTKSTVIGAAAGAAAGAGVAAATANYEGCVRAGNNFVVTLSAPLTLSA